MSELSDFAELLAEAPINGAPQSDLKSEITFQGCFDSTHQRGPDPSERVGTARFDRCNLAWTDHGGRWQASFTVAFAERNIARPGPVLSTGDHDHPQEAVVFAYSASRYD